MLHVHRSERADGLAAALGDLLASPLPDPFATEVVVVPSRGMERWLTQFLSARLGTSSGRADGICANVDFASPRRLVADVVAAASGVEPDEDPWLPERAVWPLLEVIDASLEEPWLSTLARHLGHAGQARRFAVARHLARLFDRYALHRPGMVAAWRDGDDSDVPEHARWQAELWRRLDERLPAPDPAGRRDAACRALREDAAIVDLPERVGLFGLTRLPAGHLEILQALATRRDVHLFLLHPSPGLWDRLRAGSAPATSLARRADPTRTASRNRLLASWGRDSREMQLVLARTEKQEHHHPVALEAISLLGRIQAAVRDDDTEQAPPDPGDRSIEVHACHGAARQVEVVRDAILHALAQDPTLEPRDVIVMCPDIETFAPLIQATFGAGHLPEGGEEVELVPVELRPPDLPVRLADRSLRQTNPVLGVVAELLDLADQRLSASQVLGLADREPIRRRFRFDDDEVARLQSWVAESGIRWGLDAAHRTAFRLETLETGTWRFGLDRLLVGVTMTEEGRRLCGEVLPLDDVESGEIDLAGRFAELVERLHDAVEAFARPKPVAAWAQALAEHADALTATSQRDAWQRAELQRILDDVAGEAGESPITLSLAELRALMAERLQGRPTRANFRTGHLTVCTLVPMRSVPHRVVCLIGLDDGAFPRSSSRDGDDLMLRDPQVGDRDPRSEDRQLLLDALMAAGDRLIITYTGNDERTNAKRPPAVPVAELLDAVERTCPGADVVVRHPLQPFDERNFIPGRLRTAQAWSFDRVTLEGAKARGRERVAPGRFLAAPLPPLARPVLELDDLVRFVEHPVRAFLRQRLGFTVGDFSDEVEDELPIELDGLAKYEVGRRMLEARLDGVDARTAALAEIARGGLPPRVLGQPVIEEVHPIVDGLLAAAREHAPEGTAVSMDVRVALADGPLLSGTVPGVVGDTLRTVTYARIRARHRIAAWVRLVALSAAYPDRRFEAVTIGRGEPIAVKRLRPLPPDEALAELERLADLHARGMREPLPLYCETSAAYAAGADAPARWTSGFRVPGEDRDPAHRLVLGGQVPFDQLPAEHAAPDENGPGWDPAEHRRFGRLARRLWDRALAHEESA